MRRSRLDRSPILRHRFDGKGLHRAGKTFALGFFATKNRYRQMIAHKGFVNIEHASSFLARFGLSLVDGVTFLPKKFGCAEEQSRPHLPAHDIAPLVNQDR